MIQKKDSQSIDRLLLDGCKALALNRSAIDLAESLSCMKSSFERALAITFILDKISIKTIPFSLFSSNTNLQLLAQSFNLIKDGIDTPEFKLKVGAFRESTIRELQLLGVTEKDSGRSADSVGEFIDENMCKLYTESSIIASNLKVVKLGDPVEKTLGVAKYSVSKNITHKSSLRGAMSEIATKPGLISVYSIPSHKQLNAYKDDDYTYLLINSGDAIYSLYDESSRDPLSFRCKKRSCGYETPMSELKLDGLLKMVFVSKIISQKDFLKRECSDDVCFIEAPSCNLPLVVDYPSISDTVITMSDLRYKSIAKELTAMCQEFDLQVLIPSSLRDELINLSYDSSNEDDRGVHFSLSRRTGDFLIERRNTPPVNSNTLLAFDVNTMGTSEFIRESKLKVARFNKAVMIEVVIASTCSSRKMNDELSTLMKVVGATRVFEITKAASKELGVRKEFLNSYITHQEYKPDSYDLFKHLYSGSSSAKAADSAKFYNSGFSTSNVGVDIHGEQLNNWVKCKVKLMDHSNTYKAANVVIVNVNSYSLLNRLLDAYSKVSTSQLHFLKRKLAAVKLARTLRQNEFEKPSNFGGCGFVSRLSSYPDVDVEYCIKDSYAGDAMLAIPVTNKQLKELFS